MSNKNFVCPLRADEFLPYSGEHICYEFGMFLCLAEELSSGTEFRSQIRNALIESFVIHTRNIISFLYPKCIKEEDVVAKYFFDNDLWDSIRPQLSQTLKDARDRAHKEIAHLTIRRKDGSDKSKAWDFRSIADDLYPVMKIFAENARSDRLHPNVKKVLLGYSAGSSAPSLRGRQQR